MYRIEYHTEKILALMISFYHLTHLRIGLFDLNQQEICAYPSTLCEFCTQLRMNPQQEALCRCSDQDALHLAAQKDNVHIYTCHAGLTEACVALRHRQQLVGYFMIGQFLCETTKPSWDIPPQQDAARKQLKILDSHTVQAAADILQACVGYLLYQEWFHMREETPAERIHLYIERHYTEKISLRSLAEAVYMSRSTLCQYVHTHLGTTVQDLIESYRLQKAKECLQTSDIPIHIVAAQCGFADANYFSRRFKNTVGVTPSVYRQQQG